MKWAPLATLLLAALVGCQNEPTADEMIPIEQVPPNVMEVAKKQFPGLNVDSVYKMKVDGKDAFEVRFKDKRGKIREAEVATDGSIIAIE